MYNSMDTAPRDGTCVLLNRNPPPEVLAHTGLAEVPPVIGYWGCPNQLNVSKPRWRYAHDSTVISSERFIYGWLPLPKPFKHHTAP
jgi:hypothetical protein